MTEGGSALPFSTKFLYGFGSIAYGIKDNAFAYFLLFVYVQVFGLAPDLAGLAILIMLIFDAISDPLIGYLSDNTRSRWGRRQLMLGRKMFATFSENDMSFKLGEGQLSRAYAITGAETWNPKGRKNPSRSWVMVPVSQQKHWMSLALEAAKYMNKRGA